MASERAELGLGSGGVLWTSEESGVGGEEGSGEPVVEIEDGEPTEAWIQEKMKPKWPSMDEIAESSDASSDHLKIGDLSPTKARKQNGTNRSAESTANDTETKMRMESIEREEGEPTEPWIQKKMQPKWPSMDELADSSDASSDCLKIGDLSPTKTKKTASAKAGEALAQLKDKRKIRFSDEEENHAPSPAAKGPATVSPTDTKSTAANVHEEEGIDFVEHLQRERLQKILTNKAKGKGRDDVVADGPFEDAGEETEAWVKEKMQLKWPSSASASASTATGPAPHPSTTVRSNMDAGMGLPLKEQVVKSDRSSESSVLEMGSLSENQVNRHQHPEGHDDDDDAGSSG